MKYMVIKRIFISVTGLLESLVLYAAESSLAHTKLYMRNQTS